MCPRYSKHLQYDALHGYEKMFITANTPFSSEHFISEQKSGWCLNFEGSFARAGICLHIYVWTTTETDAVEFVVFFQYGPHAPHMLDYDKGLRVELSLEHSLNWYMHCKSL